MTTPASLFRSDHAALAARIRWVDVVCTDPPFGARTHAGQRAKRYDGSLGVASTGLAYDAWTSEQQYDFVDTWAPRCRRWMLVFCSHDQIATYEDAMRGHGRLTFAPVPCVIRGMSVRLAGDGPSSWTVYMVASRPRGMRPLSGTKPGAYVGPREHTKVSGGKPLWLMREVIRDYVRDVDVVCDPCAGHGTTLLAARMESRASIGCEIDHARFAAAQERLTHV